MHVKPFGPIVYKSKDQYEQEVAHAMHAARQTNESKAAQEDQMKNAANIDAFFF